jgi:DNA invertase Pin-like site-specific DNA recombinase
MMESLLLFGYVRVSVEEQGSDAQVKALNAAGCSCLFTEHACGGRWDRPELQRLLGQLRHEDVVVVWKLDCLSRSLKDLLHVMDQIECAGAGFRSLTEAIDTTTPAGRMMMKMCGSFAEFERAMVRERTSAGLIAAVARGRRGGRRPKLTQEQRAEILEIVMTGRGTGAEAARQFKVNPATISRLVSAARQVGTQRIAS